MQNENDPPDKFIVCIKNTLKNMYHQGVTPESIDIINDAVTRTSKIVFHTYNFLNLYFMHLFNNNKQFPFINSQFILTIMRIVSTRIDNRGPPSNDDTQLLMNKLKKFYDKYYFPLLTINDIVYDDKLKQILIYESKMMVANINVNISEHYVQYVRRLVNITFDVKSGIRKINSNNNLSKEEKKNKTSLLNATYNKIKDDIQCASRTSLREGTSVPRSDQLLVFDRNEERGTRYASTFTK